MTVVRPLHLESRWLLLSTGEIHALGQSVEEGVTSVADESGHFCQGLDTREGGKTQSNITDVP